MKVKSLITLALLFVLGFSIVHEYVFAFHDEHVSAKEYLLELDVPQDHGDICDIHFEYHQSFLLFANTALPTIQSVILETKVDKESYNFKIQQNFLKPPIA